MGIAANNAMSASLSSFSGSVRVDQQAGTLKPVLASPLSAAAVVALGSLYPLIRSAGSAVASLAAGALLFGFPATAVNLAAAAFVLLVSLGAFTALGVLSAVFTLVWKRGNPLIWVFGALSWLLSGVFFPISSLPPALQWGARLLPLTYAVDALRATLLKGASLADVRFELTVLGSITAVGLPASIALVGVAVAWGKRTGSLAHA